MIEASSEWLQLRDIRVHVRTWGAPDAPLLLMLHGWMDVGATFQFVADALARDWRVVAPDQRGFGLTDWPVQARGSGSYAFAELLADVDALAHHYAPDTPINLVGHSMGANLACLYAGIAPERVRRVVDLEGFGLPDADLRAAPQRYRRWLDAVRTPQTLRTYASYEALAERLCAGNPRLTQARAAYLARHWGRERAPGCVELLADPAHKIPNPVPYVLADIQAVWRAAKVPVLHVEARDSATLARFAEGRTDTFKTRFTAFPDWREVILDDAGHMVQHDQPEEVAALIAGFCA